MLFFLQTILFENVPQSMDISMLVFINVHTHIQIHAYFDTHHICLSLTLLSFTFLSFLENCCLLRKE